MIRLYTAPTPNGRKVAIALEELALPYQSITVNLGAGEQHEEWFLRLNPNHKIPVLVAGDTVVWESGAILLYLAEQHDPAGVLLPRSSTERWEAIQYAFFQTGGIGPNLGRLATQLQRPASERNVEMTEIFSREVDRLLGVLDHLLEDGRPYLARDYSIADIMHYPWLAPVLALGATQISSRPRLVAWLGRIASRPAVQRGLRTPA